VRSIQLSVVPIILLSSSLSSASDHVIFVEDGTFTPKTVTIDRGDSVTFKALGVLGKHNVHAQDGSFLCSVGCVGDGSGATGEPANGTWSDTLVFNTPGTVGFQCDPHATLGMVGSITVSDVAAAAQSITSGISGNWYDPSANQAGHGFQIEILPDNGILAIWFVFNPAGTAQTWIYSQGSYVPGSSTVTVSALLEQAGAFPPNFDSRKLSVSEWGSLRFAFTDCNNGVVTWTSNAASAAAGYASTTFPIKRVSSVAGTTCP